MERRDPALAPSHSAFVVKLWIDDGVNDGADERNRTLSWRGRIQHVQTGQSRVFRGPFQMLAFMDRYLTPHDQTTE